MLCGDKQFAEAAQLCQELEPLFPKNENLVYAQGVIARDRGTRTCGSAIRTGFGDQSCLPDLPQHLWPTPAGYWPPHQSGTAEEALQHDPNFGAAMNNLGSVLKDVARAKNPWCGCARVQKP